MHPDSVGLYFRGGFKDCARLHLGNFRKSDAEAATAMTKHRIEFVQLVNTARNVFHSYADLVREFVLLRVICRQKFMEWRGEKADRRGQNFEGCEDSNEIVAPIRKEIGQGTCPLGFRARKNHIAHPVHSAPPPKQELCPGNA